MSNNGRRWWRRARRQGAGIRTFHGPTTKRGELTLAKNPDATILIGSSSAFFRRHRHSYKCDGKTAAEWLPVLPAKRIAHRLMGGADFSSASLVGMSKGARKRAAYQAGFFGNDRARFRLGQRLRPCPGCHCCNDFAEPPADGSCLGESEWFLHATDCPNFCEFSCGGRVITGKPCGGSGILPARVREVPAP